MRTSEQTNELATALAAAQADIQHPAKNAEAGGRGGRTYGYADKTAVINALRPPLAKQGLTIMQGVVEEDGKTLLVTRLQHSSGQFVESAYPLKLGGNPQDQGSELTYISRYSISLIGFVASEHDDDGAGATGNGDAAKTGGAKQARGEAGAVETRGSDPGGTAKDDPLANLNKDDAKFLVRLGRRRSPSVRVDEARPRRRRAATGRNLLKTALHKKQAAAPVEAEQRRAGRHLLESREGRVRRAPLSRGEEGEGQVGIVRPWTADRSSTSRTPT
jgi:hypothetical protein